MKKTQLCALFHTKIVTLRPHFYKKSKNYRIMLTIKQILDDQEGVIAGLEKKNFKGAREAIARVLELNDVRKRAQAEMDASLAQQKVLAKNIGQLMKEGKRDEAEAAKTEVANLKEQGKELEKRMDDAAEDLRQLLLSLGARRKLGRRQSRCQDRWTRYRTS